MDKNLTNSFCQSDKPYLSKDEYYMRKALALALKAKGRTFPNPLVGALIVKNGEIIAQGYHRKAGAKHAEVEAINSAGKRAKGSTLYVSLEPCTHYGRTPPCVDKIIESGIKEVCIGMIDPNPLNNGKGIRLLEEHRIKTRFGILEMDIRKNNQPFIKYMNKKMPYITVKVGQSLDGKIATKDGNSKWITSDKSRVYARLLRREYDSIMVGVNTIIKDNPILLANDNQAQFTRIIVDSRLSTPADSNIFKKPLPVIIATLKEASGQETENNYFLAQKSRVLYVKENNGQINLHDLLKKLARLGITNILVEGGGSLIGSLFDNGLVDKLLFFIAPKIIGGKDSITSVKGRGVSRVDKAISIKEMKIKKISGDILVEGLINIY